MTNFASLGTTNSGPAVYYSRSVVLDVSKYLGKHSLRAGFNFRSISVDFTDMSTTAGTFNFANDFVSPSDTVKKTDLVNLLLGYPSSGSVTTATPLPTNAPYYSAYVHHHYPLPSTLTS